MYATGRTNEIEYSSITSLDDFNETIILINRSINGQLLVAIADHVVSLILLLFILAFKLAGNLNIFEESTSYFAWNIILCHFFIFTTCFIGDLIKWKVINLNISLLVKKYFYFSLKVFIEFLEKYTTQIQLMIILISTLCMKIYHADFFIST